MSLRQLSRDELSEIAKFSNKELHLLRPYIEDFDPVDYLRCKNSEFEFEQLSGFGLEILIHKLRSHQKELAETIDFHIKELASAHKIKIQVTKSVYEYFYKLLGFQFESQMYNTVISVLLEHYVPYFYADKVDVSVEGIQKMLSDYEAGESIRDAVGENIGLYVDTTWVTKPSKIGNEPFPTFTQ